MNRNALALILLAASSVAWAQHGTTRLQCDGKYSDFLRGTRDVDSRGGYVEVRKDSVKVVSIPGFDATYRVSTNSDTAICFVLEAEPLFQGCINRFSGQLSITKQSATPRPGDAGRVDRLWYGTCRPAKPLF
jgi:hypothetical protein